MLALNTLAIGAASFFVVVAANHGQISRTHHHNPLLERSEAHLQKRFAGQATYYAVGQGACGEWSKPGDYIVALNSAQYGGGYPGPNCFKPIEICAHGKCANAVIMDECPTCAYGCLDLSEGLFKHFASTDDGVFQMTWSFGGGGGDPEPTTKKPDPPKTSEKPDPPKTTWKPDPPKTTKEPEPEPEPTTSSKKPKPTTTSTQPETTSTPEPTTSSTSTSTSSVPETTSTSTVVSIMTTSTVSAPASPSGAPGSGSGSGSGASGSNWADMAQVVLAMGRMATVAHS